MRWSAALSLILLLACSPFSLRGDILPPGAVVERIATGFQFTEGPVYDHAGGVLFTDQPPHDIVRYDIATKTTTIVDGNSGRANGLILDNNGQLIAAEGDTRRVTRRSAADVSIVEDVLADSWNGLAFNSPNDVVVDPRGGIYFTDADYGNRMTQPEGVYYISPSGELSQVLTGFRRPNGIMLSPDGSRLYLAEEPETRVLAFDVNIADGSLSGEFEFARNDVDSDGNHLPRVTVGPDGMTVDPAGNLYAAVHNAVYAWSPEGERILEIPVPGRPTNVAFGEEDGKTLFITSGSALYQIELNIVPEPSTFSLAAIAVFAICCMARVSRRR